LRVNRSAIVCVCCSVDDLTRIRRCQSHLMGEAIDAGGLRELGFAQAELAIFFAELIELLLFRLDSIRAFDGAEVLQAIHHDKREQNGNCGGEDAHLAHTDRIRRFDETGVVKVLSEHDLWRTNAAAAQGLLRKQFRIMISDLCRPVLRLAEVEISSACRHGGSLRLQ